LTSPTSCQRWRTRKVAGRRGSVWAPSAPFAPERLGPVPREGRPAPGRGAGGSRDWVLHSQGGPTLLEARPVCFRCLERGHTQQRCPPSIPDRGRCCYNCGKMGHESASCGTPPHCQICASAGKEARYRAGSTACPPIPPVGRAVQGPSMPPPSQLRAPRARAASGGGGGLGRPMRGPLWGRLTQVGPLWTPLRVGRISARGRPAGTLPRSLPQKRRRRRRVTNRGLKSRPGPKSRKGSL